MIKPRNITTVAGQVYVTCTCTSWHRLTSAEVECQQNSAVRNTETQVVLVFCSVFWLPVRMSASILNSPCLIQLCVLHSSPSVQSTILACNLHICVKIQRSHLF